MTPSADIPGSIAPAVVGLGEMAARVRAFDWSKTPIGPMDQWPEALRVAVDICLSSRFPMFVWWGPELINIYNDGYVPMLGKRHPAALGRPARDSWNDIWDVVGPQADAVMLRGEATWNERVKLVMERKGYREDTYFTWSYSPIRDADGRVAGLFCAVTEETERVRAEDRLARDALLLANVRDSVIVTDVDGVVTFWNEGATRLFGWTADEMLGRSYVSRLPEPARAEVAQWIARIAAGQDEFDGEWLDVRKDGSSVWIAATTRLIRDATGRPLAIMGVSRDVSERKRADEQLRRNHDTFYHLIQNNPFGIYVVDADFKLLQVSLGSQKVFENIRPLLGRDFAEVLRAIWAEPFASEAIARFRRTLETGEPYAAMRTIERRQDVPEVEAYDWRIERITLPDGRFGVVCYFYDLSERERFERALREQGEELARAKEEAERASEAKSEFLATLSHELRTPLTPVLLTASLMESHPGLPDDLRADVATIRRNVELESRLISDLLDLTRITRGKLHLDLQDVDLHLVVRSAIDICQREASAKLSVDLGATRHMVRGDATRLQQIFWNLINNAIKFTPSEGTITVRSSDAGDGRVRVEVTDSGAGIDPAILPKLFTAFEQGEVRTGKQFAGLGLGLAISKRLAEAHGGTIRAHSEGRGRGTMFTVELATITAANVDGSASPTAPAPVPEAGPPLSILLVEDHDMTLAVMSRLLRQIGHRVTVATSVAAALAVAVGDDAFDLIISDLGLPDGSGLDLMRGVGDRYSGRAIALTGYGMEGDVAASREAGFAAHLTKPVDLHALHATITRLTANGRGAGTPAEPVHPDR